MNQPMHNRYSDFEELWSTNEAFERASWQFDGTLTIALDEPFVEPA